MNKKIITPFGIVATLLIVGVGGYVFGLLSNKPQASSATASSASQSPIYGNTPPIASSGTAFLFGRISNLDDTGNHTSAFIDLMEDVHGQDDQEQAALVDGTCTLQQIESNVCLNNPMYLRETGKKIQLFISKDADIRLYARDGGGGMKMDTNGQTYYEQIPEQDFAAMLENTADAPWLKEMLYDFTTKQGTIVSIKEKYVP